MGNDDHLLASANLAPHGMEPILPQYDNLPTRRWLEQFLIEHEITGGILQIDIRRQNHISSGFKLIMCSRLTPPPLSADGASSSNLETAPQLFVSHRYTPHSASAIFAEHGLCISQTFLSENREEGVFLCRPQ